MSVVSTTSRFDVCQAYDSIVADEQISTPLAAILALTELIKASDAGTMFELVKALNEGAAPLNRTRTNAISLNAGCELLIAFVTLYPHEDGNASFSDFKIELARQGEKYAAEALTYRSKIAELALGFIKDDSIILTHSYSRVVMQTLIRAHGRKRISVYVTEARPRGLGVKTYEELTAAGIPCTLVLDSAVAYVMERVDFVLVGAEAVVESGGLINAVGTVGLAMIGQKMNKPFFALSESYKFHRLFPLSQYDLPTHASREILPFPVQHSLRHPPTLTARPSVMPPRAPHPETRTRVVPQGQPSPGTLTMTEEQMAQNPEVDYTGPDLITLVLSDVGSLTPEGVSQYLVGMFSG